MTHPQTDTGTVRSYAYWVERIKRRRAAENLEVVTDKTDESIEWRVAAMRAQIPPSPHPVPLLVARPGLPHVAGQCDSCGDPLPPDRCYVCEPCRRAKWLALGMTEPATVQGSAS